MPLLIIAKTPIKHNTSPMILEKLILSLKKKKILINSLDIGGGIGIIYEVNKDKVFKISDYALLVEKNFADLGIEIIINNNIKINFFIQNNHLAMSIW